MSSTECPKCGKDDFSSRQYMRVHHKRVHDEKLRSMKECEICGEEFEVTPSKKDERVTCSHDCYSELLSKRNSGQDNYFYKGGKIKADCKNCGDEFEIYPSRLDRYFFCSEDCRVSWRSSKMKGRGSPTWNGGKETVVCEFCGEDYEIVPAKKENSSFCSRNCLARWMSKNRSGQDSPLWKGGQSSGRSYGVHWNRHKKIVREYYKNCQRCDHDGSEDRLEVHHIVPYRLFEKDEQANQLSNLILLCQVCHAGVECGKLGCPEPDETKKILDSLNTVCHQKCVEQAERTDDALRQVRQHTA